MKKIFVTCCLIICNYVFSQKIQNSNAAGEMKPMFNGQNFEGWQKFLRTKGVDSDPEKVFEIKQEILHISGKEFGYIKTEKVYKNFHLSAEFKWGRKKWPPRDADTTKRDNGILFCVPAGVKDTIWPKSIECQIQEGDVGDIWLIDSFTVVVDGKRTEPADYLKVQKTADGERKTGKWNKVEIIVVNGKITYIVNGKTVNQAEDPVLTQGKIVIQSEGAEIYYRKIKIAEL